MEPSSINLCVPKKSIAREAPALETLIYEIRGEKIILASDLARIYGVATKAFNQAVKRNADKFPADFMFRLTVREARNLQRSRSQFVTLKAGFTPAVPRSVVSSLVVRRATASTFHFSRFSSTCISVADSTIQAGPCNQAFA